MKRGAPGGAQEVKRPTLAQVMFLLFVSSSPALGSVLTAQSLEPALVSVSLSLCLSVSLPLPLPRSSLSVSLSNKHLKNLNEMQQG